MKNFTRTLVAFVVLGALAACGGSSDSGSDSTPDTSTARTTAVTSPSSTSATGSSAASTAPPSTDAPPNSSAAPQMSGENTRTATFPLRIDDTRRFLLDAAGKPFLLQGDTAWSLIAQLRQDDVEKYLDNRKERGFNTVLVNLLEHKFASDAPANAYGDNPFTASGDFSTPNEKYFAYADSVIKAAADRNILVLLAPAYLGYDGNDQGWYQDMIDNGTDKLRGYGEYIGNRYKDFDNIIWVEGGDYNPPEKNVVEAVAEGIARTNPDALHTAHAAPESSATDEWSGQSWLDLDTVYTYDDVYKKAIAAYERNKMPFFLLETTYENEQNATTEGLRSQAYKALLAGGAGQVFGNNPIWHFDGPGLYGAKVSWEEALDGPGSQSMTHLRELFGTIDWWKLRPDTDKKFLDADSDSAVAAVAGDQSFALVYIPDGGADRIEIDTSALGGNVTLTWFDPSNGESTPAAGSGGDGQSIALPGDNAGGDHDWVLLARAT